MTDKYYWVSTKRMTGLVTVRDGRVVLAPPILRKFLGQPVNNLINWLMKQEGFKLEDMDCEEEYDDTD